MLRVHGPRADTTARSAGSGRESRGAPRVPSRSTRPFSDRLLVLGVWLALPYVAVGCASPSTGGNPGAPTSVTTASDEPKVDEPRVKAPSDRTPSADSPRKEPRRPNEIDGRDLSSEELMSQLLARQRNQREALEDLMRQSEGQGGVTRPPSPAEPVPDSPAPDVTGRTDPADLQAALPMTSDEFPRASARSGRGPKLGSPGTFAVGEYRYGVAGKLTLTISDVGSSGVAQLRMSWKRRALPTTDELRTAVETTVGERAAFEEFDATKARSRLEVVHGDRFVVEIVGQGVYPKAARELFERVDFTKIESETQP